MNQILFIAMNKYNFLWIVGKLEVFSFIIFLYNQQYNRSYLGILIDRKKMRYT